MQPVERVNRERPSHVSMISIYPARPCGGNVFRVTRWRRTPDGWEYAETTRHAKVTTASMRRMTEAINRRVHAGLAKVLLSEIGSTTFLT